MNNTKKLTEASILSSLFIVCTIAAVASGFGYTLYLDFIVPVFFCLICLKCEFKYTMLAGISSLLIIGLVLGNIGTAIWATQNVLLGIMIGVLLNKSTSIMDDLVFGSILGVLLMVLVDVYASTLIGYSFMKEFQGYIKFIPNNQLANTIYYLLIATFPFGMVFSVYYISLIVGKKLKVVQGNSKKKLEIMSRFRLYSRYLCCSKEVFYSCAIYILLVETIKMFNFTTDIVYLKTVIISVEYLCMYFVVKDGFLAIQNYVVGKYKNIFYAKVLSLFTLCVIIFLFKITIFIIVICNILLDIKINIRVIQNDIINNLVNN